jgi:hypothetical protein
VLTIRKTLPWLLMAVVLVPIQVSCGSDDPAAPEVLDRDFGAAIAGGGEFETVEESREVTEETVVDVVGEEEFFCTTTSYSITEAPDDFTLFNPNAEIIWPGNLLQGETLANATPSLIPVRRGPGTIVMTILNGSLGVSRDVPEVSLASVSNAMNEIVSAAADTIPARFQFSYEGVHSWEHLALSLDVSVSYLTNSLSTSLAFSTEREYHRYVVQLYQTFFDMAFQIPTTTSQFFHPEETADNLARFIQPGNPPAFISQVTFGRIFYLLIESTSKSMDMDASISASFNGGVVGGSLEAGATYVSDLENVKIKAFALGGNQGDALQAITSDFESLKNFLATGGQIRTGVPLSYVARSLAHPDQIVNMAVAADYDVSRCVPVGESFEQPIFLLKAGKENPDDPEVIDTTFVDPDDCVTAWHNLLFYEPGGIGERDAIPADGYAMAGAWHEFATTNNRPAVEFLAPTATLGSALQYPGLDFANSDFTVVAVARLSSTQGSYPAHFFFGSGMQDRSNLKIGFADNSRLTMTTGSQRVDGDAGVSLRDFNIYTFRFSQEEGMEIFVNLGNTPVARAAYLVDPLDSYVGARIGTSNGTALEIAEIKAYGIAFHEAQRRYVAEKLMYKYGI